MSVTAETAEGAILKLRTDLYARLGLLAWFALAGGCRGEGSGKPDLTATEATAPTAGAGGIDAEALEAGRNDPAWRAWAERDRRARSGRSAHDAGVSAPSAADTLPAETFEEIDAATVRRPPRLPLRRSGGGPSTLHVQVLVDRARFSPGVLDGRWGKNTEKAVYWFQHARGLAPTGIVDSATYAQLAAGSAGTPPVAAHTLSAEELAGPYTDLSGDVYEKTDLSCLCYESRLEKLAERFHATPELLAQLNPGVDLESVTPGTTLWVPNVLAPDHADTPAGGVDRIIVSRQGFYTQALDARGDIVWHFPSTLGSGYDPTPAGDYRVVTITHDPHFHYQPGLFHEVPDQEPDTMLPAGPNSPVGVVWLALSKPHYGIHGTAEPETIGYTTSHGCVRLTNWDALRLARATADGTPVEFR